MKTKTCPDCNGDGVVDKDTDNERQCPTCGGLGFVPDDDDGHEEVIKQLQSPVGFRCDRARGGRQPRGPCRGDASFQHIHKEVCVMSMRLGDLAGSEVDDFDHACLSPASSLSGMPLSG